MTTKPKPRAWCQAARVLPCFLAAGKKRRPENNQNTTGRRRKNDKKTTKQWPESFGLFSGGFLVICCSFFGRHLDWFGHFWSLYGRFLVDFCGNLAGFCPHGFGFVKQSPPLPLRWKGRRLSKPHCWVCDKINHWHRAWKRGSQHPPWCLSHLTTGMNHKGNEYF